MKRITLLAVTSAFFLACHGDVKVNDAKLDAAGKDLQKDVKKGVDTVVSKLKKIKIKVEVDKDSTTH